MIYRVHKPNDGYGNTGPFVGYISLCHGYIDQHHILDELIKTKIIREDFIRVAELIVTPTPSAVYGVHAYNLHKKKPRQPAAANPAPVPAPIAADARQLIVDRLNLERPRQHEHLFYLHPLESLKEKVEAPKSEWGYVNTYGTYSSGITGNFLIYNHPTYRVAQAQVQAAPQQAQQVQQNPVLQQGALPAYDRNIDVAAIVGDVGDQNPNRRQ